MYSSKGRYSLREPKNGPDVPKKNDLPSSSRSNIEESYDPHDHRNVPLPTSNVETLFHMIRGALGTGIMAMPKAFQNAGLVVGVLGTILLSVATTYCLQLLVKSQYELCKRLKVPFLTYKEAMIKALERGPEPLKPIAKYIGVLVDVLLVMNQLGFCIVSIIFIASNLKLIFDAFVITLDIRVHLLMIMLPVVLLSYVKNLKRLTPLSVGGNILSFVGIAIILYITCKDPIDFERVSYVGQFWNIPLFIGTTLFAIDGIGVVLSCEANMKTPKSFCGYFGVLNQSMFFIATIYLLVGFFGYLRYQSDTEDVITLNLEEGPLATTSQAILSLATIVTYILNFYGPVCIIWNTYLKTRLNNAKESRTILYEYILRTSLALATFGIAMALPDIGDFISLFGALCIALLGIAFPAFMDLCVKWPDDLGRFNWVLIKNISIMFCSILAFLSGTYCALFDIVKNIENQIEKTEVMVNSTYFET